jgi:hypothetical protein
MAMVILAAQERDEVFENLQICSSIASSWDSPQECFLEDQVVHNWVSFWVSEIELMCLDLNFGIWRRASAKLSRLRVAKTKFPFGSQPLRRGLQSGDVI